MSTINKILNPSTNRFVNIGSQKHKRLILEGVLPPVDGLELETEPMPEAVRTVKEPDQELTQAQRKDFKNKLASECSTIVNAHISQFKNISQKQTDALLKKMLYEKLCIEDKPKKKKKKLFKPKTPPPSSSDDSSDSDSDSDSD
jgi:hypothetical protein